MITTEKTLSQVLEILKKRGYTNDYNLIKQGQSFTKNGELVQIEDLVIEKVYRFAPLDDADDDSVLYAIRNTKDQGKGVVEVDPDVDWTRQ